MLLFPPYCEMAHGLVQEQQSISQSRQKKRDECRLQEGTDLFPLWIKTPPSPPPTHPHHVLQGHHRECLNQLHHSLFWELHL